MDNKDIDNLIQNALGTNNSELDFQAWKDANKDEIEQYSQQTTQSPLRQILTSRYTKMAAAAVILIIAGIFVQTMQSNNQTTTTVPRPAAMMSRLQLNIAYAQGGLDAVDNQYKKAYAKLGPRTGGISLNSLYNEL